MFIKIEYLFLLCFGLVGLIIALILPILVFIINLVALKKENNSNLILDSEKVSAYECGFEPFSNARGAFDVHFYLVALLFIIFDLEVIILLPWIASYPLLSLSAHLVVISFFILLGLGFIYEWFKKAIQW